MFKWFQQKINITSEWKKKNIKKKEIYISEFYHQNCVIRRKICENSDKKNLVHAIEWEIIVKSCLSIKKKK